MEVGLGGGGSQAESALAPSEGLLASGLASPGHSSAPDGLNRPFLKAHRNSAESSPQGHLDYLEVGSPDAMKHMNTGACVREGGGPFPIGFWLCCLITAIDTLAMT